tara:strand:+ start:19789 stop:20019 length:231 start_codon:yes stop_codon:yes gene_type:complete
MDHYGSQSMPTLQERANSLASNSKVTAKAKMNKISKEKLMKIIENVSQETPNYSLMGYAMFGQGKELEDVLNKLNC